jgi:hypothetical protein
VDLLRAMPPPYRAAAVAVALSGALHGAALMAWHPLHEAAVSLESPAYAARLEPATAAQAAAEPAPPPPPPRPKPRPKPAPRPEEAVAFLPDAVESPPPPAEEAPAAAEPEAPAAETAPPAPPEAVALAKPPAAAPAPELPPLRPEALPEEISIRYSLSSAFADGESDYTWKRDGDRYRISGSAQATGFFTVFLEGRIEQSASGRITPEGLQPERFSERRGDTPEEGLAFDWAARTVEFRRGDSVRSAPLTDSTVDWLSMIFQLAHRPPSGKAMDLRVFTQRRMYQYRLEVVGDEELELPLGRTKTVHLRHAGNKPEEAVDVWLGVDQHYLPVKLRYPVARNRLVVEQTATSIKAR